MKIRIETIPVDEYRKLVERIERYVHEEQEKLDDGLRNEHDHVTFREFSKKFNVRIQDLLVICDDSDNLSYNIGFQTSSGHYVSRNKGEFTIECHYK